MDKDLKNELKAIKREDLEYLISYGKDILKGIVKSYRKYGNNKITKRYIEIGQEFWQVMKEEYSYLKILKAHGANVDVGKVYDFLNELDIQFELMHAYFEEQLENVDEAYDMGLEYKATKIPKDFPLITETDVYRDKVLMSILGKNILREFLNYSEEFWIFAEKRTIILEATDRDKQDFYGVNYKIDAYNNLADIKIFVPEINNLKDLLVNIHEYEHAYELYLMLQKEMLDVDFEEIAKAKEQEFLTDTYNPLYRKLFKEV